MQPLADRAPRRFTGARRQVQGRPCAAAGRPGRARAWPAVARITLEATVASTRVSDALVGVGFGVLGLVSIIFALLFGVVQWAFGSLSPRLTLFRDDPIVWRMFAFAIGVFVFSVTAALVIGDKPRVSVIVPAAEVAAVLAAAILIRSLQLKAFAVPPAGAHAGGHCGAGPRGHR